MNIAWPHWLFKLPLIVLMAAVLLDCATAHARDGWGDRPKVCGDGDKRCQDWIEDAKQPDNREVSCCAFADAYLTDDFEIIGDQLFAKVTADYPNVKKGTLIPIPKNKINRASEDGGNPSGHSVTFAIAGESGLIPLCYFGGTLS